MIIKALNEDKMIKRKSCLEVINHHLEGPGSLFDPNIFGTGEDKKYKFGYIKLNGHFIRPSVYLVARRLFRELPSIVDGSSKFTIDKSGDLVLDNVNGNTGLKWFYDNFDKIKIKKLQDTEGNKLQTQLMKKSFYNLKRDEFFIDKVMVMPLHYRDINTEKNSVKIDELNQYYMDLIKAANFKKRQNPLLDSTFGDIKIQGLIVNIFEYIANGTFGKTGLQRKGVMGKVIDNSIRIVIVAPEVRPKDTIGKTRYSLDNVSVPLHHFINSHPVQAISATRSVLQSFLNYGFFPSYDQEEFDNFFSDDYLKEIIKNFDHSQNERISLLKDEFGNTVKMYFEFKPEDGGSVKKEERELTWTDVFVMACSLFSHDCRALITRYPITGSKSIMPTKLNIKVFNDDEGDVKIFLKKGDRQPLYEFKDYPDISKYLKNRSHLDRVFCETMQLSNLILKEFTADFDKYVKLS